MIPWKFQARNLNPTEMKKVLIIIRLVAIENNNNINKGQPFSIFNFAVDVRRFKLKFLFFPQLIPLGIAHFQQLFSLSILSSLLNFALTMAVLMLVYPTYLELLNSMFFL